MSLTQENIKTMEVIHQRILEFIDSEYKELEGGVKIGGLLGVCANLISIISCHFSIDTKMPKEDALNAVLDNVRDIAAESMDRLYDKVKAEMEAQKCATNADSLNP